jgi:hypothetical protein
MDKDLRFVKLTNEYCQHYGHYYSAGLNIDKIPFNPIPECAKGGLYFCRYEDAHKWIRYRSEIMHWLWDVEIPEGENVIDMGNKLKARRIILSNKRCVWKDEDICLKIVQKNGYMLRFVKNPTHEMQIAAVSNYRYAIMHIDKNDQTEEICLAAVKLDGSALLHCAYKTEAVCIAAVKNDPRIIKSVSNKTEDICLEAVEQDGFMLKHIPKDKQSKKVCIVALLQNPFAVKYIKDSELKSLLNSELKHDGTLNHFK